MITNTIKCLDEARKKITSGYGLDDTIEKDLLNAHNVDELIRKSYYTNFLGNTRHAHAYKH